MKNVKYVFQEDKLHLPCNFVFYDSNTDGKINREEFLEATLGYKHGREDVFARLDMNSTYFPV